MIPKKILFATDLSTRDRGVFQLACQLAERWNNSLLIVHIDEDGDARAAVNPRLDPNQELYNMRPRDIKIDFEHILGRGDPAESILEIERQRNVDLIVLGTHGRKGFERIFSGSVAETVIREAECPVLTMREQKNDALKRHRSLKPTILVPMDFSVHSYAALDYATSLAKSLDANMTILYVDESTNPAKDRFPQDRPEWSKKTNEDWLQLKKVKLKTPRVPYGHKLLQGPAAENITGFANERDYDFIVLGTHGRTGIGRVVMGSVAEKVVRNADCAVITVKPSNKRNPVLHFQS